MVESSDNVEVSSLTKNVLGVAGWDSITRVARLVDCEGRPQYFLEAAFELRDALNIDQVQAGTGREIIALTKMDRRRWARYVDPAKSGIDGNRRPVIALWECEEHELWLRHTGKSWVVRRHNSTIESLSDFDEAIDDTPTAAEPDVFELAAQDDVAHPSPPDVEAPLRHAPTSTRAARAESLQPPAEQETDGSRRTDLDRSRGTERQYRAEADQDRMNISAQLLETERALKKSTSLAEELTRQRRELEQTTASLRDQLAAMSLQLRQATEQAGEDEDLRHRRTSSLEDLVTALRQEADELRALRSSAETDAANELADRDRLIASLAEQNKQLQTRSDDLYRAAAESSSLVREREQQIVALSSSFTQRDQEARTLQHELEKSRAQGAAAERRADELTSLLEAAQSDLFRFRTEFALLTRKSQLLDAALERVLPRRHLQRVRQEAIRQPQQ